VLPVWIRGPVDAAAIWGPHHGPAILLNQMPLSRASTPNGRRTALAHEVCHLLIDREGALPVAEVLGGQVVKRIEQRANAFAAEWLLPRAAAADCLRASEDIIACGKALEKRYVVSRELVCHQIANSDLGPTLSTQDRFRLQAWQLEGGNHIRRPRQPA
jgi:Zn-dependent peptidase ImmA (M78 family)